CAASNRIPWATSAGSSGSKSGSTPERAKRRRDSGMLRLFGRRLVLGLASMVVVSILVFAVTNLLPGDAAMSILGQEATQESRDALRVKLGLDEPPVARYLGWLGNVVQGDFGDSFATGVPVSHTLGLRGWNTLRLAVFTALVAVPLSLGLG